MSKPIQATPILHGKDAKNLIKDFEKTNKKMQNPKYKKQALKRLEHCEKIYKNFERRRSGQTPLDLYNAISKEIDTFLKPVKYNLSCEGCRHEMIEILVKTAYKHFNK